MTPLAQRIPSPPNNSERRRVCKKILSNVSFITASWPQGLTPHASRAIIKAARTFNWSAGITGMLVFDGERFFQYVEGPPEQLALLVESISRDERHINFTPLFPQARLDQRRFAKWSMAYVIVEDTEPLGTISELQGPGALEKLQELLPLLDAQ